MAGLIMSDDSLNEFQNELCENLDLTLNDLNSENELSSHVKSKILDSSSRELNQSTNEKAIEAQTILQNSLSASLRKEMTIKAKLSPQTPKRSLLKKFEDCESSPQHPEDIKDQTEEFSEHLNVLSSPVSVRDSIVKDSSHLSKQNLFKESDKDTILARYLKEVEKEVCKDGSDETVIKYISQPVRELDDEKVHKMVGDSKNQRKTLHKITQNQMKVKTNAGKHLSKKISKNLSKKHLSPKRNKQQKVTRSRETQIVESPPILQMENLRNHLHSIVNQENKSETAVDIHTSDHQNWNVLSDENDEITANITSQMMKMLKQARCQHQYQPDEDDHQVERSILQDTLERERYRRKHCENEIEVLQKKVLEIQQELAIAKSIEFKKNSMIQQLDKMLLRMLSGWKIHEENLLKKIQKMNLEKQESDVEKGSLKKIIRSLENDFAHVLEKLEDDKQKLVDAEEVHIETKRTFQSKALQIQVAIEEKQKVVEDLKQERSHLRNDVCILKKRLKELNEDLDKQGKRFCEEELKWMKSSKEMIEEHQKEIEISQEKLKKEQLKVEGLKEELKVKQSEIFKNLDEIRKVEVNKCELEQTLVKTKEENAEKLKENEKLHEIMMNKKVDEEVERIKQEAEEKEIEIIECNKKQVLELIETHKKELFHQHQKHEDEMINKEIELKKVLNEIEKSYREKLEKRSTDIKQQMKAKVQNLFQTHYDETLQAMGDATVEATTPIITRSTSNTKHLMISIPTTSPETTNNNNTSLSHNIKLEENFENKFHSQVDSMIHEKSRNIILNLDKKLEELKNSNKSPPSLKTQILPAYHLPTFNKDLHIKSISLEHSPPTKLSSTTSEVDNRKQYLEHCISRLLHSNSNLQPSLSSSNRSSNESASNEIFQQTQNCDHLNPSSEDIVTAPKNRTKQQVRFSDDQNISKSNLLEPITTSVSTNQKPADVAQLLDFYCSTTSFENHETKQAASNLLEYLNHSNVTDKNRPITDKADVFKLSE